MPVVVAISSAIWPLARSELKATTSGEPVGFMGGGGRGPKSERRMALWPQIPLIRLIFGLVYLDLALPPAINPANPARVFSRCLFLRGFEGNFLVKGICPDARKLNP